MFALDWVSVVELALETVERAENRPRRAAGTVINRRRPLTVGRGDTVYKKTKGNENLEGTRRGQNQFGLLLTCKRLCLAGFALN